MSKDGLRRLPDHVVAPLLRALMCIPRTPEARLLLQPAEERRAPFWMIENDYNVMFRGQKIGRIDLNPRPEPNEAHVPWRWFIDYSQSVGWRELHDPRRMTASGLAATRGEAMTAFRKAFDEILNGLSGVA